MTVISAAKDKDGYITMAADSAISGSSKMKKKSPKIFIAGDQFLVGGAGNIRTIQAIQHFTNWECARFRSEEDTDLEAYAVKRLVPAIMHGAKHGNVLEEECFPALFLVAFEEHLVEISGDGCVIVPTDNRAAVGSGQAEALGYLGDAGPWSKKKVIESVKRSCITAHYVEGDVFYASTKNLKIKKAD